MIESVLIANRGEIAARVVRTTRRLGVRSIVPYAPSDRDSLAARLADEALALDGLDAVATYVNPDGLLDLAKRSGAAAIHPGYGFLSENADFARAVIDAGLTWIGPAPEAIAALGDKISARALATGCGVPVIPGITGALGERDNPEKTLLDLGASAGYPLVTKRADSGGGVGITRLDDAEAARRFLADADPTSLDVTFVERCLTGARHIETQGMRDSHGTFCLVGTRDCTVQRRNQKVVEEAPAPGLTQAELADLERWSRALFEAAGYVGVGTCEFLFTPERDFYFLEVNPRLQVEHTVSEEVCGIDLVAEQLRIASGLELSRPGDPRGHAIEIRVTSEDPAAGLMPSAGRVDTLEWPGGPGVRIDTYLRPGDDITTAYDSLIGKIIVSAPTRAEAIARTREAVREFRATGIPTSVPLIDAILAHPDFASETPRVFTTWLADSGLLDSLVGDDAPAAAAPSTPEELREFTVEIDGRRVSIALPPALFAATPAASTSPRERQPLRAARRSTPAASSDDPTRIVAPLAAAVTRVAVDEGSHVAEGDLIVVLEAMKMEKPLHAQVTGTLTELRVSAGDSVAGGDLLATITPDETA
ncbi:biotin/lipoyl-binding protein [Nanchangia anserum]|uniref:biotin carboxylase n=1 Tax=Nanchangia anserum TaxID=2692125 RepID=A0A8I0KQ32_9ACTO|nr:biotin carboxylase N-terminal domain-containing protein [Nanchangia anserum]MBD3689540.1 biotin/lipoyl-binding protein [Nanchangia anserum]QOX81731.1 biotin/lipoyl-binding protein [Nanchangia anserum]